MSEHRKLIADLQVFKEMAVADGYPTDAKIIERAIAALRGIQSKTNEPKIDADATLRNQFAGLAMQGVIVGGDERSNMVIAEWSFDIARAMVEESKKHE